MRHPNRASHRPQSAGRLAVAVAVHVACTAPRDPGGDSLSSVSQARDSTAPRPRRRAFAVQEQGYGERDAGEPHSQPPNQRHQNHDQRLTSKARADEDR